MSESSKVSGVDFLIMVVVAFFILAPALDWWLHLFEPR
jgi:hypothetical protein